MLPLPQLICCLKPAHWRAPWKRGWMDWDGFMAKPCIEDFTKATVLIVQHPLTIFQFSDATGTKTHQDKLRWLLSNVCKWCLMPSACVETACFKDFPEIEECLEISLSHSRLRWLLSQPKSECGSKLVYCAVSMPCAWAVCDWFHTTEWDLIHKRFLWIWNCFRKFHSIYWFAALESEE